MVFFIYANFSSLPNRFNIRLLYNNIFSIARQYLSRKLVRSRNGSRARTLEQIHGRPRRRSSFESEEENGQDPYDDIEPDMLIGRDTRDVGITVVGALLWPAIGSMIGRCVQRGSKCALSICDRLTYICFALLAVAFIT
jgi:hypothetical protein